MLSGGCNIPQQYHCRLQTIGTLCKTIIFIFCSRDRVSGLSVKDVYEMIIDSDATVWDWRWLPVLSVSAWCPDSGRTKRRQMRGFAEQTNWVGSLGSGWTLGLASRHTGRIVINAVANDPSATIGFHNHREYPYQGLLLVEGAYSRFHIQDTINTGVDPTVSRHKIGSPTQLS